MRPLSQTPSWRVLLVVAFCGIWVAAAWAALCRKVGFEFPSSATLSLIFLASTARRVGGVFPRDGRRAFVPAVGVSAMALFIAHGVYLVHLRQPLVASYGDLNGSSDLPRIAFHMTFAMVAQPLFIVLVEWLAGMCGARLRRALHTVLLPLSVAIAALAIFGLARGTRPLDPGAYVRTLRVVADVSEDTSTGARTFDNVPLGGVVFTRACTTGGFRQCFVMLRRSVVDPLPSRWPWDAEPRPDRLYEASVAGRSRIRVLSDDRAGLWILHDLERDRLFAAFRHADLVRVNVAVRDLPGAFSPPRGWCFAALFGCALALGFARRRPTAEELPAGHAVNATLDFDGNLHFADGTRLRAPEGASLPPGAVAVVLRAGDDSPYRGGDSVDEVRPGTVEEWRAARENERDVDHALAFSTLVLYGTPMAMAAWARLLG